MKRILLITFAVASLLLVGSLAHAALTNYVTDPGFESSSNWVTSSTYQGNPYWYHDNSNWTRTTSSKHAGSYSASIASSYNTITGTLSQFFNMPNQGLHTFTLSFWEQHSLGTSIYPGSATVSVYGFSSAPVNGTSPTSGTQIGSTTTYTGSQSSWIQRTLTFTPTANYSWFSVVFYGNTGWGNNRYFRVDDVSVVPIPPAALLLASGLLGLIGFRRFSK